MSIYAHPVTAACAAGAGPAAAASSAKSANPAVAGESRSGPLRLDRLTRAAGRSDPFVWLVALVIFAAYTTISVSRYARLDPGSWDLALFTEYVKQFAHLQAPVVAIKRAGFNLLGDHFTPILALLAPFFRMFPTPVTLLVAQASLTAASVLPVCRAARVRLGTGVSRAIGVAYALSWGLQEMVFFDFHEVAFAVPLVAFSVSALALGRPWAVVLWALPLVFVKEDQGFTVAAMGVVMLGAALRARRGRGRLADLSSLRAWVWAGGLLVIWGLGWSILAITVIIPHFNLAHQYVYWRDGGVLGGHGGRFSGTGLLGQLGRGAPVKLRTLVFLLIPVVFLGLRSPLSLIAVPGVAMRFMSTHSVFWGTGFHYNATAMPILFLAAADALVRLTASPADGWTARDADGAPGGQRARASPAGARRPGRRGASGIAGAPPRSALPRYAAAAMVVVAAGLAFRFPLARLWQPRTYTINAHVRAEDLAMARVPTGATVESTESTLAPMAARDDTSWLVTDGIRNPGYILYDATRTGVHPPPADPVAFVRHQHPGAVYREIFNSHRVYLFRRVTGAG